MNRKMVFYTLGQLIKLEAVLLLLPALVSVYFRENCLYSFLITIGLSAVIGFSLTIFFRPTDQKIFAKEGFVVVSLAWILMSLIGALPFYLSGEVPSYIDALFETISGLTTTGASVLTEIETMSRGLLFWRSFSHWVGGMGVLVMMMAIVPGKESGRSIHFLRAEVPGPTVGKLAPRISSTAKILYLIYIGLTVFQFVCLIAGGMPLFESVLHSFATAGTGGFGVKATSIADYSDYLQWVIAIFMFLSSINFNLYFLILSGRLRAALKSEELWFYTAINLIPILLIASNIYPIYGTFSDAFRHAVFQVTSIFSTTGFATADYTLWPQLSQSLLLVIMFIGGCAGSTAGGLKATRLMLLLKMIRNNLRQMLHPRSVSSVQLEGKRVEERTLRGVTIYFSLYFLCILLTFLLISLEPVGFDVSFSAVVTCFNNVGPGLAAVGPFGSYAAFSPFSKLVLSATMLLGRLEVYPLIFLLSRSTWSKSQLREE